jgi:hypothetical protein
MGNKKDPDPAASSLAHKRWDKVSPQARSQQGRKLAAARWAGHKANRPASSRKKPLLSRDRRREIALKALKSRWEAYYKAHPEKLKAKQERSKSEKKTAKEAD